MVRAASAPGRARRRVLHKLPMLSPGLIIFLLMPPAQIIAMAPNCNPHAINTDFGTGIDLIRICESRATKELELDYNLRDAHGE